MKNKGKYLKYRKGFSLQEYTLAVVVISVTSVFAIPKLFTVANQEELTARQQKILQELNGVMRLADTDIGHLPLNFGPAKVIDQFSNHALELATTASTIGVCPTGTSDGESTFRFNNGVVLTNVSKSWLEDADRNPSNGKTQGDMVCMALKGNESKQMGTDAYWVYLPSPRFSSSKTYKIGMASDPTEIVPVAPPPPAPMIVVEPPPPPPPPPPAPAPQPAPAPAPAPQPAPAPAPQPAPAPAPQPAPAPAPAPASGGSSAIRVGMFAATYTWWEWKMVTEFDNHYNGGETWWRDSYQAFLGSNYSKVADPPFTINPKQEVYMYNSNGDKIVSVAWNTFASNVFINGVKWNTTDFGAFHSHMWNAFKNNGSDVLKKENWTYVDPNTKQVYKMDAGFISPIKIHLGGQNATLNSDHHFAVDLDGFQSDNVALATFTTTKPDIPTNLNVTIRTTGGLNLDEAWLVMDRTQDGFFQNGVLDGADLFGDHLGRYQTGYEDLAETFRHQLQTDAQGNTYLALKPLTPNERFVRQQLRRLNLIPPDVSLDLMLLARDGKTIPASDVLSRIDVSYINTLEQDTLNLNQIRQRAKVYYRSGNVAFSADQWFKAK